MDIESLGRKFVHDLQNRAYELVDSIAVVVEEAVDAAVDVAIEVEDKITLMHNVTVNGSAEPEEVLKRAKEHFFPDRSDKDIEDNEEAETFSFGDYILRRTKLYNEEMDSVVKNMKQAQPAPAEPGGSKQDLSSIINSIYNYLVEEGYYSHDYTTSGVTPLFVAEDFKTYLTDKARRGNGLF